MKKLITLLVVLIILANPIMGLCGAIENQPSQYSIIKYQTIAEVQRDGSMLVEEYITYKFNKNFTGHLDREIDISEASQVAEFNIRVVEELDGDNPKRSKTQSLSQDLYTITSDEQNGVIMGIQVSLDEKEIEKTLLFSYKLEDLVSLYQDVALLDWTFLREGDANSIQNISIEAKLPQIVEFDGIHSFWQGSLYSIESAIDDRLHFQTKTKDLKQNLRMIVLLPVSLFPDGRKKIDSNNMEHILADMNAYEKLVEIAQQENESRILLEKSLILFTCFVLIGLIIFLYFRYNKNPIKGTKATDSCEFPLVYYTPAELGILMNRGKIYPQYMVATLIDLVEKGHLYAEPGQTDKEFLISVSKNSKRDALKPHEEYLLIWIFQDIGKGRLKLSTIELEEWIRDKENAARFKHKYNTWRNLVSNQASRWNFFEDISKAKIAGSMVSLACIIPGWIVWYLDNIIGGLGIIVLSLFSLFFSRNLCKYTEFGALNHNQWIVFNNSIKRMLNKEGQLPEINSWEKHLAYTISMGMDKQLIKQIKLAYREQDLSNKRLVFLHKNNLEKTSYWITSMKKI